MFQTLFKRFFGKSLAILLPSNRIALGYAPQTSWKPHSYQFWAITCPTDEFMYVLNWDLSVANISNSQARFLTKLVNAQNPLRTTQTGRGQLPPPLPSVTLLMNYPCFATQLEKYATFTSLQINIFWGVSWNCEQYLLSTCVDNT